MFKSFFNFVIKLGGTNMFDLEKTKKIAKVYYARKDIQENLVKQAGNREFVPRYGEGFGKSTKISF